MSLCDAINGKDKETEIEEIYKSMIADIDNSTCNMYDAITRGKKSNRSKCKNGRKNNIN